MGLIERLLERAATVFRYVVDETRYIPVDLLLFMISIDCEF